jgi:hypothetical protein
MRETVRSVPPTTSSRAPPIPRSEVSALVPVSARVSPGPGLRSSRSSVDEVAGAELVAMVEALLDRDAVALGESVADWVSLAVATGGLVVGRLVADEVTVAVGLSVVEGESVAEEVTVAVGVSLAEGVEVVLVEGVDVAAQFDVVMTLSSRVTEPLRASRRPLIVAPEFAEIDVNARMVPTKSVPVPKVAELPIWKNTLHDCAPRTRLMLLAEAVVRVEPIWNMKTALGSPSPSRVSWPVSCAEVLNVLTPAIRVFPPRSCPVRFSFVGRPAASL